ALLDRVDVPGRDSHRPTVPAQPTAALAQPGGHLDGSSAGALDEPLHLRILLQGLLPSSETAERRPAIGRTKCDRPPSAGADVRKRRQRKPCPPRGGPLVEVLLGERERLLHAQAGAPQHDDHRYHTPALTVIAGDRLREVLGERHRWHAVRGHLHEFSGDLPAAATAYPH